MWVVSHHLSAKVYVEAALANLSGIRRTTGSKLVAQIWPRVSSFKREYHTMTRLVLLLPEYRAETCTQKMRVNSRLGEGNGEKVILDAK